MLNGHSPATEANLYARGKPPPLASNIIRQHYSCAHISALECCVEGSPLSSRCGHARAPGFYDDGPGGEPGSMASIRHRASLRDETGNGGPLGAGGYSWDRRTFQRAHRSELKVGRTEHGEPGRSDLDMSDTRATWTRSCGWGRQVTGTDRGDLQFFLLSTSSTAFCGQRQGTCALLDPGESYEAERMSATHPIRRHSISSPCATSFRILASDFRCRQKTHLVS